MVWRYSNTSNTYTKDTMPVRATGSVVLDETYRTAIIGGTIY
jgi:hypothetical protein